MATWVCECNCKNHTRRNVLGESLKNGTSTSCGCTSHDKTGMIKGNTYDLTNTYGICFLNNNVKCLFDLEDYNKIKQYTWSVTNYNYVINYVTGILMHCLVMNKTKDNNLDIDHIDGDTLNNQKNNLRYCTRSENLTNKPISSNNTSGIKGVHFDKSRDKWMAYITKNKKRYSKRFNTKEQAIEWRKLKEQELFGNFNYDASKDKREKNI